MLWSPRELIVAIVMSACFLVSGSGVALASSIGATSVNMAAAANVDGIAMQGSARSFAVTIPVTDLVAGTNVVQLGADQAEAFFNVNIALVDVPGGVPVLPGSNDAYPGS